MRIRADQLHLFARQQEDAFVQTTARYLSRRHAERASAAGLTPDGLPQFVRETIARGGRYGIVNEPDVRALCELRLILGPRFDTSPQHAPLRAVLEARELTGAQKVDRMYAAMHWCAKP